MGWLTGQILSSEFDCCFIDNALIYLPARQISARFIRQISDGVHVFFEEVWLGKNVWDKDILLQS